MRENSYSASFMQIDLQNLFYAARNKGQRIDFEKIWAHFHQRETEVLTDAKIYMIRGPEFDSSKFEKKLQSVGYNLCIKNAVRVSRAGRRPFYIQANHDVQIAVDCMDKIQIFDKWILMSGDGDFAALCKYLKERNKKIEIWGFKECHNVALEPYADRVHFIEDEFFFKKPSITVFGPTWDIK